MPEKDASGHQIAAAKSVYSTPRAGRSGVLAGAQLFTNINVSLLTIGACISLGVMAGKLALSDSAAIASGRGYGGRDGSGVDAVRADRYESPP